MFPIDRTAPFVLLDDARPGGGATLYRRPSRIIAVDTPSAVRPALAQIRAATTQGLYAAGFLSYEAGTAFEPRHAGTPRPAPADAPPLLWFGLFDRATAVDGDMLAGLLGDPAGACAAPPRPRPTPADYRAGVARILDLIAAGDLYQANLTFVCDVAVAGDPLALYARLRRQGGGWGGVVFTGRHWLLSASPELFFTLEGGRATARPMKGTAPRHPDPARDAAGAAALAADPKQRAENLMIVDLIRNDLARVAAPGGVAVPALFTVEHYPTVHHLTSTVTATLADGRDAVDVLAALFPCGSITGAPKVRAMAAIDAIEDAPRGPYTGSIGRIGPDGGAAFNVAIRTLVMADGANRATLGVGSAIVADSDPAREWEECLLKAAFVTDAARPFDLIETIRFDAMDGFVDLDRHIARLRASAEALGFACDRHQIRNELQAASFPRRTDAMVRLRLARSGALAIELRDLPPAPQDTVMVTPCPRPVAAGDFRLRHKTSDRAFYDTARHAAGTFEVAFVDDDGFVTEGSFTSIFVERDGMLLTPPLSRGLIPGTLRQRLIDEGRAREEDIPVTALRDGFLLGNAIRGLISARLVA